MALNATSARKRFEKSLLGTWASYLGGGHDMHTAISLTFLSDGTGTLEEHGFDEQYDREYVSEPTFRWRSIGAYCIEITHRGEARSVSYDFRDTKNEYGLSELRMFEPEGHQTNSEILDSGFRHSRSFIVNANPKKKPNQSPEPTSGLRPAVAHL